VGPDRCILINEKALNLRRPISCDEKVPHSTKDGSKVRGFEFALFEHCFLAVLLNTLKPLLNHWVKLSLVQISLAILSSKDLYPWRAMLYNQQSLCQTSMLPHIINSRFERFTLNECKYFQKPTICDLRLNC